MSGDGSDGLIRPHQDGSTWPRLRQTASGQRPQAKSSAARRGSVKLLAVARCRSEVGPSQADIVGPDGAVRTTGVGDPSAEPESNLQRGPVVV